MHSYKLQSNQQNPRVWHVYYPFNIAFSYFNPVIDMYLMTRCSENGRDQLKRKNQGVITLWEALEMLTSPRNETANSRIRKILSNQRLRRGLWLYLHYGLTVFWKQRKIKEVIFLIILEVQYTFQWIHKRSVLLFSFVLSSQTCNLNGYW